MNFLRVVLILGVAIALASPVVATDPTSEAKELFATYSERINSFDPAVADLYADDAKIENTRSYPDGTKRTFTVPAPQYKAMLRAAMPAAKKDNDQSDFLGVEYKPEGGKVRIETIRFSRAKLEGSPVSMVVGVGAAGKWMILEEHTESRPPRPN